MTAKEIKPPIKEKGFIKSRLKTVEKSMQESKGEIIMLFTLSFVSFFFMFLFLSLQFVFWEPMTWGLARLYLYLFSLGLFSFYLIPGNDKRY
jgi:hypothetical protein